MVQVWPFVKVSFVAALQKRAFRIRPLCPELFLCEPILLVYDRVVGQNPQGLSSCSVQCLIFGSRNRENFG